MKGLRVVPTENRTAGLGGRSLQSALAASALDNAALFSPLRRLQALIDRRLYGKKYGARKTVEVLAARLRDKTDLDAPGEGLVSVVRERGQPTGLWGREPGGRR